MLFFLKRKQLNVQPKARVSSSTMEEFKMFTPFWLKRNWLYQIAY